MISIHNHDSVQLNPRVQPIYGRTRDRNHCCFSTVTLKLYDSPFLFMKVEDDPEIVQMKDSFKNCWDVLEWRDYLGHLSFWTEFNNRPTDHLEVCVWYMDEYGKTKDLPMAADEQALIVRRLNTQCRQVFGKTCRRMLSEARNRMDPKELEGIEV